MSWSYFLMLIMPVAVGLVCNKQNEILIAKRNGSQQGANLWEFPGGKIEPRETDFEGLVRELKEEIGIEVTAAREVLQLEHAYPEQTVALSVWLVTAFQGEVSGRELQPIRWVTIEALSEYVFLEANKAILNWLIANQLQPMERDQL